MIKYTVKQLTNWQQSDEENEQNADKNNNGSSKNDIMIQMMMKKFVLFFFLFFLPDSLAFEVQEIFHTSSLFWKVTCESDTSCVTHKTINKFFLFRFHIKKGIKKLHDIS